MTALYILSSLGGATAFFAACFFIIKTVTGQVTATKDNTDAVRELTNGLTKLQETVSEHDRDIAFLRGQATR